MKKVLLIFRWELNKLFSNWHKTIALFLLPAVLMMLALNVFPLLINYMSTGSFSKKPIVLISAPPSIREYINDNADANVFSYTYMSLHDFSDILNDVERTKEMMKGGTVICFFAPGYSDDSFDNAVKDYYHKITNGSNPKRSEAFIYLGYDTNSLTGALRAQQFREGVLEDYHSGLIDKFGGEYANKGSNLFSTDTFNPVTKLMDNRAVANSSASRIVPGMLLIMMYYCAYSLVSDMFASERERGFWSKLIMSPVSPSQVFAGKILAITAVVSLATYLTALLLFVSSWVNTSNDALSLLPFGMMLTPSELLILIITIPFTVFVMAAACISTVFSLNKMQDITVNLQLPLILFLGDFFVQMFRGTRPTTLEYLIPMHNSLALISDTYMAQEKLWHVIAVLAINTIVALLAIRSVYIKEGLYDNRKRHS